MKNLISDMLNKGVAPMLPWFVHTFENGYASLFNKTALGIVHGLERLLDRDALNMTGLTPFEVIYRDDLFSVRRYLPLKQAEIELESKIIPVARTTYPVPLVYIPPLMAPGFAFDLFPRRSLVQFFLARGFEVYMVDFGHPTKSHSHLSFENYILEWMPAAMKAIRHNSGREELSLFGFCMGGLFAHLYTAIHEDKAIRNIITVASPIDMHQMGAAGKMLAFMAVPAHKLARRLSINLRQLHPDMMHVPGRLGTLYFNLSNPMAVLKRYWDLVLNLWDRDYLIAQDSLGYWINNLMDYPGATMQELVVQLGLANKLARGGKMTIGKGEARMWHIRCSILAFAGSGDKIVPPDSAAKIMDLVSSVDKTFRIVPGGHVGMLIGSAAPEHLWETAAEWLAQRSESKGCSTS